MFDQPPLTAKEVFGRGFVHGLAMLFGTLLLSLFSMLPSRYRFYMGSNGSPSINLLFVWPLFGTIGCVVLLFGKNERTTLYRAGVLASYVLFVAMTIAMWTI
ncbi:MAG TPA: hypothetical protein VJW94_15340 [Candidatus Acidoferrum sp.]|nr:hypothetical protein [Candidatus Acidoferrum sp.]